jgi:hypothetical protein
MMEIGHDPGIYVLLNAIFSENVCDIKRNK